MKNVKTNVGSFAIAKLQAKMQSILAIIAFVAIVGFCFAACEGPEGPMGPEGPQGPAGNDGTNGNDGAFTSIDSFVLWLSKQPDNTAQTAYSVKLNVASLGGNATQVGSYYRCVLGDCLIALNTKYVNIDFSGSYITNIPNSAFSQCTSLTSVTIPASVTRIENYAFSGCTSLTSVTFATGSNIPDATFGNNVFPEAYGNGGNALKTAYSTGKAGTYTRPDGNSTTWTKISN